MVDPNGMKEEQWSIGGLVERGIQALPGSGSSGEGPADISGEAPPPERIGTTTTQSAESVRLSDALNEVRESFSQQKETFGPLGERLNPYSNENRLSAGAGGADEGERVYEAMTPEQRWQAEETFRRTSEGFAKVLVGARTGRLGLVLEGLQQYGSGLGYIDPSEMNTAAPSIEQQLDAMSHPGGGGGPFGKLPPSGPPPGSGGRGGKQFRGPDPGAEGRPHSRFRTDDKGVTHYETYNFPSAGVGKRVDLVGPPHKGVPTPHVVDTQLHVNPRDPTKSRYTEGPVRPARPDEIPKRKR
jgi:hypothetical protein